jgi:hypothetical protein
MKKILSIAALAATISIVCLSCTSNKNIGQSTANKTISMAVFTSSNYNAEIYEGTTAGLSVTVKKLQNDSEVVVLEKSFPSMPLQFFPAAVNAFKDSIQIAGVKNEEALQVSYVLTYNSNGNIIQMQGDEVITGMQSGGALSINI